MIVTARPYDAANAAEMARNAAAIHARLMKPKNRVAASLAVPEAKQKTIPFMARKLPEWQTRPTSFDSHVLITKQIFAMFEAGIIQRTNKSFVRIAEVVDEVLKFFPGVTAHDLKSHRRTRKDCLPRQIAMYEAKLQTTKSYPEIGRWFGGRDHTTVLHSVNKIERMIVDGYVEAGGIRYPIKGASA